MLTEHKLPVGASAFVEQCLEVYTDPRRPDRINVPAVTVDNVQRRPLGGGVARYWRDDVSTLTADTTQRSAGDYCLNWVTADDTWTAGSCLPADGA